MEKVLEIGKTALRAKSAGVREAWRRNLVDNPRKMDYDAREFKENRAKLGK